MVVIYRIGKKIYRQEVSKDNLKVDENELLIRTISGDVARVAHIPLHDVEDVLTDRQAEKFKRQKERNSKPINPITYF